MIAEQSEKESAIETTRAETISSLLSTVVAGTTLKELRGVPNSVMEGIYAHAYEFYQLSRFDDAETFFRFLCLYEPFNPEYKLGLAATLQQKKQYQNAINVYESMRALVKKDHRPELYAGQCYLYMKNMRQAQESFMAVLESDAPAPAKAQAQAYLTAILGTIKTMETTKHTEESHDGIK